MNNKPLYIKSFFVCFLASLTIDTLAEVKTTADVKPTAIVPGLVIAIPADGCESSWDSPCDRSGTVEAPPGMQACRFYIEITSMGRAAEFKYDPMRFYPNDPESPDRYKAYSYYLKAPGSRNPLDKWGSHVRARNIGLSVIPANATNFDRYQAGCDMPTHD